MKNNTKEITKSILIFCGFWFTSLLLQENILRLYPNIRNNKGLFDIIISLFLCVYVIIIFRKELKSELLSFKKDFLPNKGKYIKYYLTAYLLMIMTSSIVFFAAGDLSINENAVRDLLVSSPIFIISASLIGPFYEEIIFRLNFKKLFKQKWVFATVTGLLFGFFHLTDFTLAELLYLLPYSVMGISLGLIFYDSDNIFSSIVFHMMHNTISVLLLFL